MIKIVLPEGEGPKVSNKVKIYTESGEQIHGVSRIEIDIKPNEIVEAKLTVYVADLENFNGVEACYEVCGEA